jgi:hypothetical protein
VVRLFTTKKQYSFYTISTISYGAGPITHHHKLSWALRDHFLALLWVRLCSSWAEVLSFVFFFHFTPSTSIAKSNIRIFKGYKMCQLIADFFYKQMQRTIYIFFLKIQRTIIFHVPLYLHSYSLSFDEKFEHWAKNHSI